MRYECKFDDGQHIKSFNRLANAKKFRRENNWKYISRYIVIYDSKKNVYI